MKSVSPVRWNPNCHLWKQLDAKRFSFFFDFSDVLHYAPQTWDLVVSFNRRAYAGSFPDCLHPCCCHPLKHICSNENSKQQTANKQLQLFNISFLFPCWVVGLLRDWKICLLKNFEFLKSGFLMKTKHLKFPS